MSEQQDIVIETLTAEAFRSFGDVICPDGAADRLINRGMCERFHDRARMDFGVGGRAGISLFRGQPYALPLTLEMVERHPDGSQAFMPMSADPFLVIVAEDCGGVPRRPRAFLTVPGQGVNYLRGTWHGVLTPLERPCVFTVIDRIGPGDNLEEYWFDQPYRVVSR